MSESPWGFVAVVITNDVDGEQPELYESITIILYGSGEELTRAHEQAVVSAQSSRSHIKAGLVSTRFTSAVRGDCKNVGKTYFLRRRPQRCARYNN